MGIKKERSDEPMVKVKPVQLGNNTRMSFGRINEVMEMPNLIEVQKNSLPVVLERGAQGGLPRYCGDYGLHR